MNRIMILIILLSLLLSPVIIPEGESEARERVFRDVHLNLKENDVFSPEMKHDIDESAEVHHVTANKEQYGNVIISTDWANVGTWRTDSLDGHFTISQGNVIFNMWYQTTEDINNNQVDWEFTIQHNEQEVVNVTVDDVEQNNTRPIEITAEGDISEDIDVSQDDSLSIHIRYRSAADCDIYFDNITYDSGVVVEMDSVIIVKSFGSVITKFYDAWAIDWDDQGKYFCSAEVDGVLYEGNTQTGISDGGNEEDEGGEVYDTIEMQFNNINVEDGDEIVVTISYGSSGSSEGWTYSYTQQTRLNAIIDEIYPNPALDTDDVHFEGHGTDENIKRYVWRSSLAGEFYNGTDSVFSYDDLPPEKQTIYFKVQKDSGEWSGETTTTLTVHTRPVAVITSVFSEPIEEGDEVQFTGYGEDDGNIDKYVWTSSLDGEIKSSATCDFSSSTVSSGDHVISLTVRDNNGVWSYEAFVNLTILEKKSQYNSAPEVLITSHMNRTIVSGNVMVVGTASDDDGDSTIAKLEYSINNGTWHAIAGTTLWSFAWDSTSVDNGEYLIQVRGYDGENYSQEYYILVTVANEKGDVNGDENDDWDGLVLIAASGGILAAAVLVGFMVIKKKEDYETMDCPECGVEANYIDEYDSWYCYTCDQYVGED